MTAWKPPSESKYECPLYRKPQKDVCHNCAFYQMVHVTKPGTSGTVQHWDCVYILQLAIQRDMMFTHQSAQKAAEEMRNKSHEDNLTVMRAAVDVVKRAETTFNNAMKINQLTYKNGNGN
jgi:hypothetical protein